MTLTLVKLLQLYLIRLRLTVKKQEECFLRSLERNTRDWKTRFLEMLSVIPRKPVGDHANRKLSTEEKESVISAFGDDPFISQRKVAQQVGLAQSWVNKILKENNLRLWKMTSVQELQPDDTLKILSFCEFVLTDLEAS